MAYRKDGKPNQRTLYWLGKVEDYSSSQLENIARKLLDLAGLKMEDIVAKSFQETNRLNYGYALVIKKLCKLFDMDKLRQLINIGILLLNILFCQSQEVNLFF